MNDKVDWPFTMCIWQCQSIQGACPCQCENVYMKSNLTKMVISALDGISLYTFSICVVFVCPLALRIHSLNCTLFVHFIPMKMPLKMNIEQRTFKPLILPFLSCLCMNVFVTLIEYFLAEFVWWSIWSLMIFLFRLAFSNAKLTINIFLAVKMCFSSELMKLECKT